MSITFLFAQLDEISSLQAVIDVNPHIPFAHLAHRNAMLAKQIIEFELVRLETQQNDEAPAVAEEQRVSLPLAKLRKIASTYSMPSSYINALGDTALIALMIEAEIPLDDDTVWTACANGYTGAIRQFIDCGVDLSANNNKALQLAIEHGRTKIVRLLLELPLEYGIDPSVANLHSLPTAVEWGFTTIVRLLLEQPLERGINPAEVNNLEKAIRHNRPQIVRLLLEHNRGIFQNEDMNYNTNSAFLHACEWGHTEIVRLLLEKGGAIFNPSAYGNQAFQNACARGAVDVVRLLLDLPLERGVDPAASDNRAFKLACENGRTEIVRLLLDLPLERGVNPAASDNHALKYAHKYGQTEIVRLLLDLPLERGVDPAASDNHALVSRVELQVRRGYCAVVGHKFVT